ncbi:MAG: DUF255 domain-containing protein [Anaerolineae bacterium]|nr:DUF255 domain-containing protein [Anaerolineae bacterium]
MKALNQIPEAWRLAMQKERDAMEFYTRMAQAADDKGIRSLFEMLAEQEAKHHALLEAEYRRLFEPDLELGRERLPLTWYEWEEDSFRLADELDLPVMLYITAPWCEPCHLMERTTLAEPEVVTAINDTVIPILVDADKRPDVDRRYSKQGWPTTAFLNAQGEVLESHNFMTTEQVLAALQRVKGRVQGDVVVAKPAIAFRSDMEAPELEDQPEAVGELHPAVVEEIWQKVVAEFDEKHGGFGQAPKFHHADALEFVLAMLHRTGDEKLAKVEHTSLQAMAQSGLYDKVEGGFFRYAANADWSEPHFEKLAGDQARLLELYLRAYKATAQPAYLDVARGVLGYIDAVLWDRDRGYFYSSQEADLEYYHLDAAGRAEREAPYVDKTVYTRRNAAIASAYMLASAVLDDPRYADLAIRALEFIWQNVYKEGLGMHHYFDGQLHVPGLLIDQVTMASAWLDAYEHFGREIYVKRAQTLVRFADNALRDEDGRYFDALATPEAVGRLRHRAKPFQENVLAAEVNLRLFRVTGHDAYRAAAQHTLEALVPHYADMGLDAAHFGLVVDRFLRKPLLITVVGENEDPKRGELVRAARRAYAPNRTVQAVDPQWEPARLARLGYPAEPAPVAYVCLGNLCARPTADPNELLAQAQAMVGQERAGLAGTWEYKGYVVDEGFKPEPGERFQYFLRIFKNDERVFRYCVWTSKNAVVARWPGVDPDTEAGRAELEEHLRAEGHKRVEQKIAEGAFENWLLNLGADGEEEVILEERDE